MGFPHIRNVRSKLETIENPKGGVFFKYLVNPTKSEFLSYFNKWSSPSFDMDFPVSGFVRGLLDGSDRNAPGDLYVWDPGFNNHKDAAAILDIQRFIPIFLCRVPDRVYVSTYENYRQFRPVPGSSVNEAIAYAKKSRYLEYIYGPEFVVKAGTLL